MPKTIQPTAPDPDIEQLQRTLQRLGYGQGIQVTGYPSQELWSAVALFQMQHLGPSRLPLEPDRIVGQSTWWALANPSGPLQRSGYALALSPRDQLTPGRLALQEAFVAEYRKDVHEEPDGSNRGPQIDSYWGNTGLLGQSWCCALVSTLLLRALGHYPLGYHHTSVSGMVAWAKAHDRLTRVPKPMDIWAIVHADGTGHTGVAPAIDDLASVFATFEGNCGNRLKHGRRQFADALFWIDPFQDEQPPLYQRLPELEQLAAQATR
jgi:hypothetical protein